MIDNETNDILREILKWQKFQTTTMLRRIVSDGKFLDEKKQIEVYKNSDGEKSSRDLQKITGVGRNRVRELWRFWVNAGIAEQTGKYKGGRVRGVFTLDELGIYV